MERHRKEYFKEYYRKNRAKIIAQGKAYYRDHKEELKAYSREYYKKNKAKNKSTQ